MFQKGNPGGPGGYRKGAGRPKPEFYERARKIGDPVKILQLYWDVATGKDMEQVVTDAGESIATPAQVKDRLKAGELYLDRILGKVNQGIEITNAEGDPLLGVPTSAILELVKTLRAGSAGNRGEKS